MSGRPKLDRRGFLTRGLAVASAALLGGCDSELSDQPLLRRILDSAEALTRVAQRTLLSPTALAREYSEADLSKDFKANGSTDVDDDGYRSLAANAFADWKLKVDGLVAQPLELSLAELRAMPSRTQITRHDCVEGWSCIGQWKGPRLSHVLQLARPAPEARFVVFHCLDRMDEGDDGSLYYESVDLDDAYHEQTLLAWELNGRPLPVQNGAPLRVRVERQLGYKQPKYVHRIELVAGLGHLGQGRGGYWEDQGYAWYGGI